MEFSFKLILTLLIHTIILGEWSIEIPTVTCPRPPTEPHGRKRIKKLESCKTFALLTKCKQNSALHFVK